MRTVKVFREFAARVSEIGSAPAVGDMVVASQRIGSSWSGVFVLLRIGIIITTNKMC